MIVWMSAVAAAGPSFDWVEAQQVGRTLVVDYARSRGPLYGESGVRLVVSTREGRFTMRADAAPRRGRWTFERLPWGVREVEIRCPGGCEIRDVPLRGFSVPVASDGAPPHRGRGRPPQAEVRVPPPPNWASDPAVIEACDQVFVSGRDEIQCLELSRSYPVHPGAAIRACGQAFVGSADELSCIRAAAKAPINASPAIAACGRAFTSSRDELSCVQRVVDDPVASTPVIDACARAFVGSAGELRCIDLGLSRPRRAPEVVQACDRAFVGESEQIACIERALPR